MKGNANSARQTLICDFAIAIYAAMWENEKAMGRNRDDVF
jgi:hypothetical protein